MTVLEMEEAVGVFKIRVDDDFLFYYRQSSLVYIMGKLYSIFNGGNPTPGKVVIERVLQRVFHEHVIGFHKETTSKPCPYPTFLILGECNGEGTLYLTLNHIMNPFDFFPPALSDTGLDDFIYWLGFVLNRDTIVKRILRIQRWIRSRMIRKKCLHLLAVLVVYQSNLCDDVVSIIASFM